MSQDQRPLTAGLISVAIVGGGSVLPRDAASAGVTNNIEIAPNIESAIRLRSVFMTAVTRRCSAPPFKLLLISREFFYGFPLIC